MPDEWSCKHFSLSNALDDRPADLPHLLRRFSDELERRAIEPADVLNLIVSSETTGEGLWWSVTVYWSPTDQSIAGLS